MAALNMSFRHGQTWDVARANFEKGLREAESRYGSFIKRVDWSEDRTSARLSGQGFAVDLTLDETSVHASGEVPFFAKMLLEAPVKKFLRETFR